MADRRTREDQPEVTVLKSGVVDGMAYSLYSDGSIEAQMPEGMMRFASIDELRAHLDQRLLSAAILAANAVENKTALLVSVASNPLIFASRLPVV